MRNFGTPVVIDLKSNGAASATVTPTTTVQSVTFTTSEQRQVVDGDNWPLASGIGISVDIGVDQAAAGGSVINWDELFRSVDSLDLALPLLGTPYKREFTSGPVAKHLIEFISSGYRYTDFARAQIPTTDGDTAVCIYFFLPFWHECFVDPTPAAFMIWTGWLNQLTLTVSIATASTIAAVSTGAATEATCTVRAWIESYPSLEPVIPLINQWPRYTQAASAGGTSVLMQNVGEPYGLTGAIAGSRIAGMFELMNKLGFGGATTADNITQFVCDDLGQTNTSNIDAFLLAYRRMIGHAGPVSGVGATTPIPDGAGNPWTMANTAAIRMNNAELSYVPWRFPAKEQALRLLVKWRLGNLTLSRSFTTTPSSGTHIVQMNLIRQLSFKDGKVNELLNAANIPATVRAKIRPRADIGPVRIPVRG